jgi:hypothetical protein
MALLDGQGTVTVWDTATARPRHRVHPAKGMVADPAGRRLFVWDDHEAGVLPMASGRAERLAVSDVPIAQMLVDATGTRVVMVRADGTIEPLLPERRSLEASITLPETSARLLSPGGGLLAAYGGTEVELIDLDRPRCRASATLDGPVRGAAWLGDDAVALIGSFGVQSMTLCPRPD